MNRSEHLLSCLAEECAEVGQRVSKALRFGLQEKQPGQSMTNAERIVTELLDLRAVIEMLEADNAFLVPNNLIVIAIKKAKVEKFMDYAEECGTLHSSPPQLREGSK